MEILDTWTTVHSAIFYCAQNKKLITVTAVKAYIAGEWDGCAVWVQWDPPCADAVIQISLRKMGGEWGEFVDHRAKVVGHPGWAVIPLWREGWDCRVRLLDGQVAVDAEEVRFLRARCLFRFSAIRRELFSAGSQFFASVDGAVAAYELPTDLQVEAGDNTLVEMHSVTASGYSQLDRAAQWKVVSPLGTVITNDRPSFADLEPTGRDYTTILGVPEAVVVAFSDERKDHI